MTTTTELSKKEMTDFDDFSTTIDGVLKMPSELAEAPEDIRQAYLDWAAWSEKSSRDPRRYFQFVNTVSHELEQVDAYALSGSVLKRAKEKNISKEDLRRLVCICDEMHAMRMQKSLLRRKWMAFITERHGKDVFDWRRAEILDMYARFCTAEEIRRKLDKEGYSTTTEGLYKFFLNNKEAIDRKRSEFIRSAENHYLATDAGRMETLAMLHGKFMELFNDAFGQTKHSTAELTRLSQELRAIIDQARKEIKGEEIKLTLDGKIDVTASIQAAQTIQDISKKLPINIIPIYLVAVKQGINPNTILSQLVGSFYKDFNGFNRLNAAGPAPTTMDIIRNYDWNDIQRHHAAKAEQVVVDTTFEELPFAETVKVQSKREKLMALINKNLEDK